MSEALLGAIKDYVAANGSDEKVKDLIATLGGVADRLRPSDKTSPGRLAAKLAAGEADAKADKTPAPAADAGSTKEAPKAAEAGAEPKTFAEAKAAALELVGR